MITKLHLVFSFLLLAIIGFSQSNDKCGTTIVEQSTTYDFVQKQRSQTIVNPRTTVDEVPIKIHIVGASNGALAIDSSVVFDEFEIVNTLYAEANIQFVPCGNINYINDNAYVTFVKNTDETLCDIHDKANVINIYFVPNLVKESGNDFEDLCGYAYNFDIKTRVFMDKGCTSNGSTLAHELGHSFSLLHTHSTSNGDEHANGTNCSIAGDLLCDTPADPTLSNDIVNNSCEYTGTELDNQGNPYMPDPENILSYSRKTCRVHFSLQQLQQMEDFYLIEGGFLECTPDVTPTNDLNENSNIEIYPNPSSSSVFMKNIPENAIIELIDLNGRKLWETKSININEIIELTSFQNLDKGIYFVKVKNKNKNFTQKLVKM